MVKELSLYDSCIRWLVGGVESLEEIGNLCPPAWHYDWKWAVHSRPIEWKKDPGIPKLPYVDMSVPTCVLSWPCSGHSRDLWSCNPSISSVRVSGKFHFPSTPWDVPFNLYLSDCLQPFLKKPCGSNSVKTISWTTCDHYHFRYCFCPVLFSRFWLILILRSWGTTHILN